MNNTFIMMKCDDNWLQNLKVGDKVISNPNNVMFTDGLNVIRITKNFIITGNEAYEEKWRKEDGTQVSESNRYKIITQYSQEKIDFISQERNKKAEFWRLNKWLRESRFSLEQLKAIEEAANRTKAETFYH